MRGLASEGRLYMPNYWGIQHVHRSLDWCVGTGRHQQTMTLTSSQWADMSEILHHEHNDGLIQCKSNDCLISEKNIHM